MGSPEVPDKAFCDLWQHLATWCKAHHVRAFLGEFGAPASQDAQHAVDDMLSYVEKNRDVWVGFTWWSAGPWWGDYMFSVQPKQGKDAPQMGYLASHLQSEVRK